MATNKELLRDVLSAPKEDLPVQNCAENQVFLSFRNDSYGIAFRDWWNVSGAMKFALWFEENRGDYEH